jgi:signal peptidase I
MTDSPPATEAPAEAHAGFPDPPAPRRRSAGSFLAELPVLVLIAFVLALLMKTFLVQAFFIPSPSMEPTLLVNDRVLVNKLSTLWREPRRGEVVVFSEPTEDVGPSAEPGNPITRFLASLAQGLGLAPPTEKDFIKRIIGLPGETLEMREGVVYIDGQALPEAPTTQGGYLSAPDMADFGPVTIPEGEYFMMGDNRPRSADSRSFGSIPGDRIVGRAFVIIWPFGRLERLPIAAYDGQVSAAAVVPVAVAA